MGTGRGDDAAGMLEGFGLVAVGVRGRVVVVVVGAKVTMAGMVFSFRKRVIRFSNAMPLGSSWIVCTGGLGWSRACKNRGWSEHTTP